VVDAVCAGGPPISGADRLPYELVRRTGLAMVPRTIAIDDAIRDHAARQVVILGAGLDGRAYRMAELADATVFEVDHPASQQEKLRRVGGLTPAAARVVPVAIDLGREHLPGPLERAGFDHDASSTWVWEGVVPYLTRAEVRSTLAQVADLSAPGSRLVVNYQARSLVAAVLRRVMRVVLRVSGRADPLASEPWRSLWRPDEMRDLLGGNGFTVTSDSDLLALSAGLDLPPGAAGSLRTGRVAVASRP
jgi:methyltransferase (TIGR00027 family)